MKRRYGIRRLGPGQMWKLRKQIVLNSLYFSDYVNTFGLDPKEVYDFFEGWLDFLADEMMEDHPDYKDEQFWDYIDDYDKYTYLKLYLETIDWGD